MKNFLDSLIEIKDGLSQKSDQFRGKTVQVQYVDNPTSVQAIDDGLGAGQSFRFYNRFGKPMKVTVIRVDGDLIHLSTHLHGSDVFFVLPYHLLMALGQLK